MLDHSVRLRAVRDGLKAKKVEALRRGSDSSSRMRIRDQSFASKF